MNITDLIKLLADKTGASKADIEIEIDNDEGSVYITILDGADLLNDDRDEADDSDDDTSEDT